MRHIIYMSTSKERFSDEELARILEAARRNNAKAGVTGLLLYAGQTFFQVLEGPRHAVESIYDRIFMDERHARVKMLAAYDVETRQFCDWSMGFRRLKDGDIECEEFFDLTQASLPEHIPPHVCEDASTFLRSFAQTKLQAA